MTTIVLVVVAVVVLTATALLVWILRNRQSAQRPLPPLFIPLAQNATPGPPILDPVRRTPPVAQPQTPATTSAPPTDTETTPKAQAAPHAAPREDDVVDGAETVRFFRPADNAVQLLPGRLEVLAGATPLREIRFVRIPGEPPHLILGRDPGPSPQHVGLGSATVSRRHARLDYSGRSWQVRNLSRTNPLIVNDDALSDTDAARPLVDGDRLELGEVVLRFHDR